MSQVGKLQYFSTPIELSMPTDGVGHLVVNSMMEAGEYTDVSFVIKRIELSGTVTNLP